VYRPKDRNTRPLFPELFPFGGKLDDRNRWLRIVGLVPFRSFGKNGFWTLKQLKWQCHGQNNQALNAPYPSLFLVQTMGRSSRRTYTLSLKKECITEEPCAGNLHARSVKGIK